MEQRFDKIFENSAFDVLGEEKKESLKRFINNSKGKKAEQLLPELIKLNSELSRGKPLNETEKKAIFEAVSSLLNDEERRKFTTVLQLIKKGF